MTEVTEKIQDQIKLFILFSLSVHLKKENFKSTIPEALLKAFLCHCIA